MSRHERSGTVNILIVEDSPTQALQLRRFLESYDVRVTLAANAEAALEGLNEEVPDLIIADYHLPGMNGDELVRQIRMNARTRSLPILMLTQDAARDAERQGLESGADAYVPKSSDFDILLLRIRGLLRQQGARTSDAGRGFVRFRRGRVMLVHTVAQRLKEIEQVLAQDGYDVQAVPSYEEALALSPLPFDCAIIDIGSTGGFELCSRWNALRNTAMKEQPGAAVVQIIGIDAPQSDNKALLAEAFATGVDDIVSASVEKEFFKLRVRALVRRKLLHEENYRSQHELRERELALAKAQAETASLQAQASEAEAARMKQLLEGERRFRTIFDAAFQLSWLVDLEGRIAVANRTALDAISGDAGGIYGQYLWDSTWWASSPEEAEKLKSAFAEALTQKPVRYEAQLPNLKQGTRIFDMLLRPALDANGDVSQIVIEAHDITDFKQTEAALRQSQKMEAIGQITGGVAHDFNNLLMAVLANLELLNKRMGDADPTLHRLIDGAMQGAQRGAALTQRLLAFARRQELRMEAVDVGKLLRGMSNLIERSIGPRIALRLDVADLPPAHVDPNQLELAVLNLAVNARDAMPEGGALTIAAQRCEAQEEVDLAPGGYVCIRVTDTGTGMDAETLKRAIEPFFSTKDVGKGTGLGLSMVHGLAMQTGGTLRLTSEPGIGTAAEIWLPVAKVAMPAASEPVAQEIKAPRSTILVVDDDFLISMSTADMLEELGHKPIEANSVERALELLRNDPTIDLMITDYAMPGMTGGDLALAAREIRPDLPVLLATGYADPPGGVKLDLPRLTKPYDQTQLSKQLAALLRK
jgi:PAS domain S-box-containing protein